MPLSTQHKIVQQLCRLHQDVWCLTHAAVHESESADQSKPEPAEPLQN